MATTVERATDTGAGTGADTNAGSDPAGWRTWVAVDAPPARPRFSRVALDGVPGEALEIALAQDPASFGKWISAPISVTPGATYRCWVWQRAEGVAHPDLSAPAMLTWRGDSVPPWSRPWHTETVDRGRDAALGAPVLVERQHLRPSTEASGLPPGSAGVSPAPGGVAGDKPPRYESSPFPDGWRVLELVARAPEQATVAEIECWFRHAPGARAWFAGATLEEVPARPPRTVTLATVRATPPSGSTVEGNRQLLARLVEQAADGGADVVCLPENALVSGTGLLSTEAAERLDGPTVTLLSQVAAERRIWVVAQLPQRDSDQPHRIYNTAVLLDREGQVRGVYHKMHLTTGEWERGIVPGEGPVVVDTEIGKVGMLVCFDLHFPEAVRLMALAGAEVIFGPTVGDRWPERRDAVTRAHAVANGVYVVTSLVLHPSDIVDPEGRLIARAAELNSVALATVDLDYKATPAGRAIGPDNGTSPGSYWPGRRTDLYR